MTHRARLADRQNGIVLALMIQLLDAEEAGDEWEAKKLRDDIVVQSSLARLVHAAPKRSLFTGKSAYTQMVSSVLAQARHKRANAS